MISRRRHLSLDAVRADGWFERLGEENPSFHQVCEVVGDRFVAFAFIAGVRITMLTVDRRSPDATLVDFVLGDDPTEQRLALGEFRRRLAAALLADEVTSDELPDAAEPEDIQQYIGIRYVLLAPIFGIALVELRVGGLELPSIVLEVEGVRDELTLDHFRRTVQERIREQLSQVRAPSPFAIDLGRVPEAEAAASSGNHDKTIDLLGAWPGPLALLLRTPEGQALAPEARAQLARALGVLGTAYVHRARFEWAEEVLRLGIQWGQDGPAAADLFRRLGDACLARERHGEAIGLYRRALSLGAPQALVLPPLAACYLERKRHLAAIVCAEEAIGMGNASEELERIRDAAAAVLGPAWTAFRGLVPRPEADSKTLPPVGALE